MYFLNFCLFLIKYAKFNFCIDVNSHALLAVLRNLLMSSRFTCTSGVLITL